MKKHLTWIAVLSWLLLATNPLSAQMVETNAATISASLVRGIPGSTVDLPVSFSHTGAVAAVQFDLNYNPARMAAASLIQAGFPSDVVFRTRQIAPGTQRILIYRADFSILDTNVAIGSLPFTVPAGLLSGGGPVTISNALAAAPSASSVNPLALLNGGVLVQPVYRGPDGVVDLFLNVESNRVYVIQASTNLTYWVNISTNFATFDYVVAQDHMAIQSPIRFYRAVSDDTAP